METSGKTSGRRTWGERVRRALPILAELVTLCRRHWGWVVTAALLGALLGATLSLMTPAVFESSVTLVILPPQFASTLKAGVFPILGYQRLAMSDSVMQETQARVRDRHLPDDGWVPFPGADLQSRIFVSRNVEQRPLAPLLELVARGPSADAAATAANTWAEVFIDYSRELSVDSTSPTLDLVDEQYRQAREELGALQTERLEVAATFHARVDTVVLAWRRRLDRLSIRWESRLAGLAEETAGGVASYQMETREALEGLARRRGWLPETTAKTGTAEAVGPGVGSVDGQVTKKLLQVVRLRTRLAQTRPLLSLEKMVSDNGGLPPTGHESAALFEIRPPVEGRMLTQDVNAAYSRLALELFQTEVELQSLPHSVRERFQAGLEGLETLQRTRRIGLEKLLADRALMQDQMGRKRDEELAALRQRRDEELSALERQRDTLLAQLDRDIDHKKELFQRLADTSKQAQLARAEREAVDVRIGAPAVPVTEPLPRQSGFKVLGGVLLGGLLGVFVVLAKKVR